MNTTVNPALIHSVGHEKKKMDEYFKNPRYAAAEWYSAELSVVAYIL